ncbi:MAG TPA: hypothetical protein DEP84_34330 [Chloroflexi bacterium]|nr:hypothetical protein [Chloroflexota bacterium]
MFLACLLLITVEAAVTFADGQAQRKDALVLNLAERQSDYCKGSRAVACPDRPGQGNRGWGPLARRARRGTLWVGSIWKGRALRT